MERSAELTAYTALREYLVGDGPDTRDPGSLTVPAGEVPDGEQPPPGTRKRGRSSSGGGDAAGASRPFGCTFAEFRDCFPRKYRQASVMKRLYEEAALEWQQLQRDVEAQLQREYPAGAAAYKKQRQRMAIATTAKEGGDGRGTTSAESGAAAAASAGLIGEATVILKERERQLACEYKRLVAETAELQTALNAFDSKLRTVADRCVAERSKGTSRLQESVMPTLKELTKRIS